MRWRNREESENVEDRRDESGGGRFPFRFPRGGGDGGDGSGGFPRGIPIPGGGSGLGIVGVLVLLGIMYFLGIDPRVILDNGDGGVTLPQIGEPSDSSQPASAEDKDLRKMTAVVLKTTEDVWKAEFQRMGKTYVPPKLVLYRGDINSGCGMGVSQMGPFYCPIDHKVYLDTSFFKDMKNKLNAPGEFAEAYVIAHEIGHHVQTQLGIMDKVMAARAQAGDVQSNAIQVKTELQADCLAGLWANRAQQNLQFVEPGDIEAALNAAAAIGDDRLQKRTQGRVVPDAFTHGSSEQRVTWFRKGFDSGKFEACDTFGNNI